MAGDGPAILSARDVAERLDYPSLIAALDDAFREGCEAPTRHHHAVAVPDGPEATLLLMPAWLPGRYLGTKVAHVFPGNGARGLAAVQSTYLLSCGTTGRLLAVIDGGALTTRRTVAASALAARHLAKADAARLLVVGTGQLARQIAHAHAAVRPIMQVEVWGRDPARAAEVARAIAAAGLAARPVADLAQAVGRADIVSCCTLSREPLVRGEWLKPGAHLDLMGGFRPAMREADDAAVARAEVFVDTGAALSESGDLAGPLARGVLDRGAIAADLADLVRGRHPGRTDPGAVTLFKSVGAAIEDLAAAVLCHARAPAAGPAATL